ncbi:beta strand repeat-containing protein [Microvirga brassicacearum]|uniref:Cadherin domain-containing protein n=1 Tax=Microvirga brassicacearum TaxID=2580413 RepID=A0A5N3PDU4_9HYPH|nr:hypothetical protein [Microvirga brassicacearum]KAB0267927.1 hypothetical protein FEZ63_06900 [Microvirga brassicacearum]
MATDSKSVSSGSNTQMASPIDSSITLAGEFSALAVVSGDAGNNTLQGSAGDDQINGLDGNDLLIGGNGSDTLNGGNGTDTVSYATETGSAGVRVNLGTQAWTYEGVTYQAGTGTDTWGNVDTYVQIEKIIGTAKADVFTGGNNFLPAYIEAGAGDDIFLGGAGSYTVDGGAGNDYIVGGNGRDIIVATLGSDTIMSSRGNDTITGNWSTTLSYENETAFSEGLRADLSTGNIGKGGGAADKVSKIGTFIGTNFGDIISGNTNAEVIRGLGGNDKISAGGIGSDTIDGGDGDDTLDGGYGADSLLGGSGSDILTDNGGGDDTLDGGTGNDILIGGLGNDVYYVDSLDDIATELNGTADGNDTVYVSVANFDGAKLANIENVILVGDGSVIGGNAAPEIGGAAAPITIAIPDVEVATPFAGVTITDDSPTVTVTITMGDPGDGAFTHLGAGAYDFWAGTYTITGDATSVQAAVQALQFDPTDHPDYPVGHASRTHFTIAVVDSNGVSGTSNSNISVDSITTNRAPTIIAAATTFTVNDSANVNLVAPFADVTIDDTNASDVLTVTIALDAAAKGVLVPVAGGSYDPATGIFTITGAAADVLAAVRALQFNPEDRAGAPNGSIETTTFTIAVVDAGGLSVASSSIAVDSVHVGNLGPAAPVLSSGAITDSAQDGTVVGTLSAADPDEDAVTFAFVDALEDSGGLVSADGRFKIVNGEIIVNDQGLIQVAQQTSFSYAVAASDGNGGVTTGDVTITVGDQNKAPSVTLISNAKVNEHAAAGTLIGVLSATDPNGDALTYALLDDAHGRVELVGNELRVKDGVTLDYEQLTQIFISVAASDGGESVRTDLRIAVMDVRQENVVGTAGHDIIKSGTGRDILNGAAGNDILSGGGGLDQLIGGTGKDAFVFDAAAVSTNADAIADFSRVEGDQIWLAKAIFVGCGGTGMMNASAFVNGTAARDADDRIIYDGTTGRILYDADGAGLNSQSVLIATINGATTPMLTASSFFMV